MISRFGSPWLRLGEGEIQLRKNWGRKGRRRRGRSVYLREHTGRAGLGRGRLETPNPALAEENSHQVASFIIDKEQKQPKRPSMDGWMTRMQYVHKMEYYSARKREEALIHATMWMNLENSIQSGSSQTQTTTCCVILLVRMFRKGKAPESESGALCQGPDRYRVSFWVMKLF